MRHVTGENGVTLVELLVVVAIVGILALALAFSYQGWVGNYRIESQTKQLYGDLMEARTRALTRNFVHFFVVPSTTSYQIYEDTNNNTILDPGAPPNKDQSFWTSPKTVDSHHQLRMFGAGTLPSLANPLTIDTRGFINVGAAGMYFGADHDTSLNPDYDCIIITQDRIRMGKWDRDGTVCGKTGLCCER